MSGRPTVEVLFPEIANLHGDAFTATYLTQCRPDLRIVRTALTDTPAFASERVGLVYLGPMTERGQLTAIERLRPHAARIADLVDSGTAFLFTHNALEVLGGRLRNDDMGYDATGLELFDFETTVRMFGRVNSKVMGVVPEVGAELPVLGWKSQFSTIEAGESVRGFLTAERGIGRTPSTAVEGVRRNNLLGTSLLGPLVVTNPALTRWLLTLIDPDTEPVLAHAELAWASYAARLRDFRDPRRWSRAERVRG